VLLSNNPVDNTLVGFSDVREKADALLRLLLRAPTPVEAREFLAGDRSADDMDSDDIDSDDIDSDDMDSDDMDSDDMDSDDIDSDDMDSDDIDSDDLVGWDRVNGRDAIDRYAPVYATAQRRSVRTASVTPGTADEMVVLTNRRAGGALYFRVRGHLGASDGSAAFTIVATKGPPPCADPPPEPDAGLPPFVRGRETLILTNTSALRFDDPKAKQDFLALLKTVAARAEVNGHVVDLADNPQIQAIYASWHGHPDCVAHANVVVESIRRVIARVTEDTPLKYVVLVGPDNAIPFRRAADRAEISRESHWRGPYAGATALEASTS
jgi:hypothetical protein